uniref:Uncharacterized protein n=1 Tax=Romanomermis culicivorax TaxID=13658 RepID=A0A915K4P8_ROMCU
MIIMVNNICLEEKDNCNETKNIAIAFKKNGFPQTIIRKAQKPTRAEKEETEYKCTINVPYSGHFTQKVKWKKYKVRWVATSKDTIPTHTSMVAPTREKEEKQGVVYSIPMEPCQKVYIGETGRQEKC